MYRLTEMEEMERTGGVNESGESGAEERPGRDEVLERVFERRERHRERSIFVRVGVVIAGGAVSLFAAPLSVITPEFGLPLLLFGLRLLALEFDWAARLYTKVAKLARRAAGTLEKLWPKSKVGVALGVVALVVVFVAVFLLLG